MKNEFEIDLEAKLSKSINNDYKTSNYDYYRFGEYVDKPSKHYKSIIFRNLEKLFPIYFFRFRMKKLLDGKSDQLNSLYQLLDANSKELLIDIFSFHILGFRKVRINGQAKDYLNLMDSYVPKLVSNEKININLLDFELEHFDLSPIGYNINLFALKMTIVIDFIIEQYSLKFLNGKKEISAQLGETVLDLGACWGDTSLYFANKVGKKGKVYAFEFIPSNLEILEINLALNPDLKDLITVIPRPVSDISGKELFFIDSGPASKCSVQPFISGGDFVYSISLDDFISEFNIPKVDVIKMDIEGAELSALKGSIGIIKRFRPKLMIALYHSINDFSEIPNFLKSLDLNYSFHLGHFTIHKEETILFAYPN
ncbi:MAG: FkbM family methyltransferase [Cytophagia bacterium]|nr:FkbM family methyltransferase [Cytophagia bacterium]